MNDRDRRTEQSSRRVIDVAIGILVGLRGCSEQEAFDELVQAVHSTGIGPGRLARSLVDLATGVNGAAMDRASALRVWGDLVARQPTMANVVADSGS